MKKLNFSNELSDDDEKLISILKTLKGKEPSEQFVDNTWEKFLILKSKQKRAHKPLKAPLYLMLVIALILFVPTLFSFGSQLSYPNLGFDLKNLTENIFFQLDSWYIFSLIVMIWVPVLGIWVALGLVKFRNPFV